MTGFADRFSDSQRAALAALGYAVLEQRGADAAWQEAPPLGREASRAGAAAGRDPASHEEPLEPSRVGAAAGRDPALRRGDNPAHPTAGSRPTAAPTVAGDALDGRRAPAGRAGSGGVLPASVLVVGMAAGDPLAEAIERALESCVAAGDARVRRGGSTLEVATGGQAPAWRVHLDQLRRSPRHKAALWRALRSLRRGGSP